MKTTRKILIALQGDVAMRKHLSIILLSLKRVLHILTVLSCCIAFCANAESNTSTKLQEKYSDAELLMVDGKYEEAAALFDAIGSYSDASKMAMYCKALAAAENYGMYEVAIDTFGNLGDFKDCKQLQSYYTGRKYEQEANAVFENLEDSSDELLESAEIVYEAAQRTYSDLMLFKDSLTRANACQKKREAIKEEQKTRLASKVNSTYHAYMYLTASKSWVFRNYWNSEHYGLNDTETPCFSHLSRRENGEITDYGGTFTDVEMTENGRYTIELSVGEKEFGGSNSFDYLGFTTDIPSDLVANDVVIISNVEISLGPKTESQDVNIAIDTSKEYARFIIIDKENKELKKIDYEMPKANEKLTIAFDINGL